MPECPRKKKLFGNTKFRTSSTLFNESRKFETDADQVSLEILQQLGRDPESMAQFFDNMAARRKEGLTGPSFFDSHLGLDHRRASIICPKYQNGICQLAFDWRSITAS